VQLAEISDDPRRMALMRVFKAFDADGSGTIETNELKLLRRDASHDVGSWTTGRNRKALSKLDADGSGEVDCEEFVNYFNKILPAQPDKFEEEIRNFLGAAPSHGVHGERNASTQDHSTLALGRLEEAPVDEESHGAVIELLRLMDHEMKMHALEPSAMVLQGGLRGARERARLRQNQPGDISRDSAASSIGNAMRGSSVRRRMKEFHAQLESMGLAAGEVMDSELNTQAKLQVASMLEWYVPFLRAQYFPEPKGAQ